MKKQTSESRVSQTILQQPEEIVVGDTTYHVAPPTVATIILLSELISFMPKIKANAENIIYESLSVAKDCRVLGDILATLILGAKGLMETKRVVKTRLFGLVKDEEEVAINHKEMLAKKILEELRPSQLSNITNTLLSKMEIAFFFGISTSLSEINLLRQTKETETTQSGQ